MSILVVFEGPDGVGKSTVVDGVISRLRQQGMAVEKFAHRNPASTDPYERALDFATQRREFIASIKSDAIVIADRWQWSTDALFSGLTNPPDRNTIREPDIGWDPAPAYDEVIINRPGPVRVARIVLDASDDVLDARLKARGEMTPYQHAERAYYRRLQTTVRTDRKIEHTLERATNLARRAIRHFCGM